MLLSKRHLEKITVILPINVSKKVSRNEHAGPPVPFAIFICLGGQIETSVVFGRTSHESTSLQAEKLT